MMEVVVVVVVLVVVVVAVVVVAVVVVVVTRPISRIQQRLFPHPPRTPTPSL